MHAVVLLMNKFNKTLIELQGEIPNSLYSKLDARWQAAIKQDKEIIEFVLVSLQQEASEKELQNIFLNSKPFFRSKKKLTRLLVGESQSVQDETEEILKKFLGLVPEEEEPERLKGEDLSDNVNIDDIIPDEIVFDDTTVDTHTKQETIIIIDEETMLPKDISTGKDKDKGEEEIETEENVQTDDGATSEYRRNA